MAKRERPLRLPFEFHDKDRLGPWDILLSEDTIEDMRQLESIEKIEPIMKILRQISSGKWDKYKLRHKKSSHTIPVYEVRLPGNDNIRIIWQVDYGFSTRSNSLTNTQLVKVWAVTSEQEQIDNILNNLSILHNVYTAEHNRRCTIQKMDKNNIILPETFEDEEDTETTNKGVDIDDDKLLEVHKMLVTNKFIPLSKNLFKSLIMDGSDFTFQVSKIEYEIINNPTSAIVIGRSGTGKTTCIVFRQLASHLASQPYKSPSLDGNDRDDDRDDRNVYKRQIFITMSYNLCWRVKDYFNRLKKSAMLVREDISKAEYDEYIKKRSDAINAFNDDIMREEDDEKKELNEIPNSFHQLTDKHFPLFITYEKFSEMLQGTYDINFLKLQEHDTDDDDEEEKVFSSNASWAHFVNYNLFKEKYWPRFSDCYRKKLSCELVYSEFSVIKGTNPKVDYLSREEYREISTKKYPAFCYNRDEVYDLFERYEKMKARNGDYDSVDQTLAISRAAETRILDGPHIHEVYIDECQDNHIVDFALILKLFGHADSIFMAGDIAQCIARGSSFRFQDLRALIYEWNQENHGQYNAINPEMFELNVNYRSHNGILRLASSVIDLLREFFPDSIDHLPPEQGKVNGPRPIISNGIPAEGFFSDVISEQVENSIEFGASQVIIVRDDKARIRLKELNGDVGLILTVFEAKGMEFNDVTLYNFFTDSPALLKWRVILSTLESYSGGIQTFLHEKHYILSSELKHLYVAVTRARERLRIFDEDTRLSEPIQTYWKHKGLVDVKSVEEVKKSLSTFLKKSSPSEWNQEGKTFFEQRKYEQAIFCFERSGNEEGRKLAYAYHLQNVARASFVNGTDRNKVKLQFISAAKAFEECFRPSQAGSCYEVIGMYKEAGYFYEKGKKFELSARCYLKAKMYEDAGRCFETVGKYTEAVVAYKDGCCYSKVIELVESHEQEIDKKKSSRIIRFVNVYYRRKNDKKMSEKALSVLPTQKEQVELLKEHAPEELLELHKKNRQFREAAKILQSLCRLEEAAYMFICSEKDEDIIESLECFLNLCRISVLKNKITDITHQSTLQELQQELNDLFSRATKNKFINKVKSQSSDKLKETDQWKCLIKEYELYFAYLNKNLYRVHDCIQFFRDCKEFSAEFCATYIWMQIPPQLDIQAKYWRERLQFLLRLCEMTIPYINIISQPQNATKITEIHEYFENIFFVSEVDERQWKRKISPNNLLIPFIKTKDAEIVNDWHIYDEYDVHWAISQFLISYIFECILNAGKNGRTIPEISHAICHKFEFCQKQDCRNHHVNPTPPILHQRLKLAFLQYTVMRQLDELYSRRLLKEEQSIEVKGAQRWWTERIVRFHIRYQSPQTSCPEITYAMLAGLPKRTRNGFISLAYKIWLTEVDNFEVMLKCAFIFHQLDDKWGIDKFYWKMKKLKMLSPSDDLLSGFEYYRNDKSMAIPIGNQLSLFFSYLYSDQVTMAIAKAKAFIRYTINNINKIGIIYDDSNNIITSSLGDIVSLVEFTASLIFAVGSRNHGFYLPRAYLVNYFDAFNMMPFISSKRYDRNDYSSEIEGLFNQVIQLLDELILDESFCLTIILRLIRLSVLIGLNESTTMTPKVFRFFKYLNEKVFSTKIKRYLTVNNFGRLKNILHDDINEKGCDSLVLAQYYHWGDISKISSSEHGIMKLTYSSVETFHSALQQLISPIAIEERATTTEVSENQPLQISENSEQNTDPILNEDNEDESNEQSSISEAQEPDTEIQAWLNQINESKEAAKKIQIWFRKVLNRQNTRKLSIQDKIYNEVRDFCQNASYWKVAIDKKGAKMVHKYYMLLRGPMVDMVTELNKLQNRLDKIQIKLQKSIDKPSNEEELEICFDLKEDLKYIYDENIKLALESLSVTESLSKHKEASIEWLENELKQAKVTTDQVKKWIKNNKLSTENNPN